MVGEVIEHRVRDRRIVRLVRKWLSAGVLEEGKRTRSEVATIQGGSISPLLAESLSALRVRPEDPTMSLGVLPESCRIDDEIQIISCASFLE
jgi:hypothetical protein